MSDDAQVIRFRCPNGHLLKVKAAHAGKTVRARTKGATPHP